MDRIDSIAARIRDLRVSRHFGRVAAIRAGLVDAAHDCSEGGLAVALAEMAIAGGQGLKVELKAPEGVRPDAVLFGEAHSRVIVAVPLGHEQAAQEVLDRLQVPYTALGESLGGSDRVTISVTGANVQLSVTLQTLKTAYETPLREILG